MRIILLSLALSGAVRWEIALAEELPAPRFDHRRGLYFEPFRLTLTTKAEGAAIRYTTDGSDPTATTGKLYTAPLRLTNTAMVRVAGFRGASASSAVETRSFVFPESVAWQSGAGLATNWGVNADQPVPAAYGINPAVPASPLKRGDFARALRALPIVSLVLDPLDLFDGDHGLYAHPQETGDEWERAASLEFLPVDGSRGFHSGVGVRIQGGFSRRPEESPKHSLRLVFRKRYGAARLKHPIFDGQPTEFSTLVLRGGNNNTWLHPSGEERHRADYLRDPWMRATASAMGLPAPRDRLVHLFLNGLYWGIYDLCERPDEHFASAHFGGAETDYDTRNADKILSGDDAAWRRLFALANAGITNAQAYTAVGELLDLPAFMDFMILNFYGANGDWDRSSNWYAVRRRDPAGRYQFIEWDGERTLENLADNRLADDDDLSPTRLFQKLRVFPEFRRAFAERARRHLTGDGALTPTSAAARYRRLAEILEPAIAAEAARWGNYRHDVHRFRLEPFEVYTREEHWQPEVKRLLEDYFPRRTAAVERQFRAAELFPP
jgi:CotH kinase protein/Chitobiase/beta-hexosaminidase C-terminal domain